jgi:3-oxoacyl-[acyl-carrier-protein] synthase II
VRHTDATVLGAKPRSVSAGVDSSARSAGVAITGVGAVTPLGRTCGETWRALLAGQFIHDHVRLDTKSNAGRARITQLALAAAGEAIAQSRWPNRPPLSTALVVGTSKGAIEEWLTGDLTALPFTSDNLYPAGRFEGSGVASGRESGLGSLAADLGGALHLGPGPQLTMSGACASGLHALIRAALLIRRGEADRVLVVAAEASVHPLFISSFRRLGVLAPKSAGCRPFDAQRAGFLMSEAAAAVCLESDNSLTTQTFAVDAGAPRTLAQVDRFALGGDATHLTGSDPDAAVLTRLLHDVMGPDPIDVIHAHATGTVANDPIELAAIERTVESSVRAGAARPHVYSHKGALGHSLGAAGLVSVVLNCMMHRESVVPPNVQTHRPLPVRSVQLEQSASPRRVLRSVAIAAGFGGATATIGLISP